MQTDFSYIGVNSDLGHGWKLDNKVYTYRYWNKQNYNNPSLAGERLLRTDGAVITATSGVDKLNGYRKVGDITTVSWESSRGILRTGLWFEWAYTDRYQIPSDPRTWVDAALPNFHEHFITTSAQPFVGIRIQGHPRSQRDRRREGRPVRNESDPVRRQWQDGGQSGRCAERVS